MRKVYVGDCAEGEMLKDLLVDEGVDAITIPEGLRARLGIVGVWVLDEDEEAAEELVGRFRRGEPFDDVKRSAWPCPRCREPIERQFSWCWRCGMARPT